MNGTLLTVLETDPPEVRFQKELLKQIIANELTEAQQGTFLAYYVRGLSMAEIAKERGSHRSTVQRTLVRAEKKDLSVYEVPETDSDEIDIEKIIDAFLGGKK